VTRPLSAVHLNQIRCRWGEGTFSDATTLRFPPQGFAFAEIDQRNLAVKLGEITYLRSVKAQAWDETSPHIVTFARLEQDRANAEMFPGVDPHAESGERLYSANSLITHTLRALLARDWLRYDGATWQPTVPDDRPVWQERARAVLALLTRDNRLLLGGALGRPISTPFAFEDFDAKRNFIPVGRLGFLRELVWHERPHVAFNAAFFLLEHDDFFSHHSALGEAYNLYVHDGAILRPPLYRRAAFYQTADPPAGSGQARWQAGYFSMADVAITLPDGTTLVPERSKLAGLPFALDPESSAEIAVYTRARGLASHRRPLCRTPVESGRLEFTLVDRRVVGHKAGGGLDIPQNGLVLSFHPAALPVGAIPDERLPGVRYSFVQKEHRGIRQAIQVGPMLLQNGEVIVSAESLGTEAFWPTPLDHTGPDAIGVVPTDYPDDTDRTRAGRIGLGVDGEGRLVVVAVPGTERGTHRPDADSSGATLLELAELLAQAGAVDAINLDGGGSTQLFYRGGLTTTPGNRYRLPGAQFERMIPSAGVLR